MITVVEQLFAIAEDLWNRAETEAARSAGSSEELATRMRGAEASARARANEFVPGTTGRELRDLGVEGLQSRAIRGFGSLDEAEDRWRELKAVAHDEAAD